MTGGGFFFSFLPIGGAILLAYGALSILSGIFAILSCVQIIRREKHNQACTFCLCGSIIALFTGGIVAGIFGITFYFLMKDKRERFAS
jgi:uncharacterized membrane protein